MRMATPNAALSKPAAAVLANGAKAAAALRLLKQAQMRRQCNRVYNRQPKAQGNPGNPRQQALCPAFCRSGQPHWDKWPECLPLPCFLCIAQLLDQCIARRLRAGAGIIRCLLMAVLKCQHDAGRADVRARGRANAGSAMILPG